MSWITRFASLFAFKSLYVCSTKHMDSSSLKCHSFFTEHPWATASKVGESKFSERQTSIFLIGNFLSKCLTFLYLLFFLFFKLN